MQPISKFVQIANSYFTGNLPYQIINTKEFLQKADKINETYSPLPDAACFAVCGVVSLYPNVNNEMKFQLRKKKDSRKTIRIRNSRRGVFWRHLTSVSTAMHVSILMGMAGRYLPSLITVPRKIFVTPVTMSSLLAELDRELVSHCPVPLLSSRIPPWRKEKLMYFAWSRFRDDGITILPNAEYVSAYK